MDLTLVLCVAAFVVVDAGVPVCQQPKKIGPCRAAIPRYFYNSASGRCEKFTWGGCQPNGNNFETCGECNLRCSTDISLPCQQFMPDKPNVPTDVCEQPKDPGPCRAYIPRYYYNSASGRCEKFIYGGCRGNGNNFETCVECSVRCSKDISLPCVEEPNVPTPTLSPVDVCELPKDPSPCMAYIPRYYYNSASGKCEKFIWGGCPGNENNFETCLECSLRCERKGSPAY